jgi:tetratricopeptide (TPR) repeat protein
MHRVLDLPSAKVEIARTFWGRTKGERLLSPYCFVFGAGISDPSVPTASKLVPQFRDEIKKARLPQPPDTLSKADSYYECIDRAFPTPQLRRDFLRNLIEGKLPSTANLQAARLLGPQGLASLAVTTNFDRMLPRALHRLGYEFIDLDHPDTIVSRSDLTTQTVQVLQIHGTYEHYDFCNVQEEILRRARELTPLLYSFFVRWCPIVVGYSGWEDDAIMTALKLRLSQAPGSMAAGLYWMCYTQADADALPAWLKDDLSVRIVVPSNSSADPGKLPAEEVFEELLEALEAARTPAAARVIGATATIAAAEDEIGRGELAKAYEKLSLLEPAYLTTPQRVYCGAVLKQVYVRIWEMGMERATLALDACRSWESMTLALSPEDPERRSRLAHAIYGQGLSLLSLEHHEEEAIAKLEKALDLCVAEEPRLTGRAAHTNNALAVAQFRLGRHGEAFAHWRELVLATASGRESEEALAYALFNLGHALQLTGRTIEAQIYWSVLRDRYAAGDPVHAAWDDLVARAAAALPDLELAAPTATPPAAPRKLEAADLDLDFELPSVLPDLIDHTLAVGGQDALTGTRHLDGLGSAAAAGSSWRAAAADCDGKQAPVSDAGVAYPIYTSGEFEGTDLKQTGGEALRRAAETEDLDQMLSFLSSDRSDYAQTVDGQVVSAELLAAYLDFDRDLAPLLPDLTDHTLAGGGQGAGGELTAADLDFDLDLPPLLPDLTDRTLKGGGQGALAGARRLDGLGSAAAAGSAWHAAAADCDGKRAPVSNAGVVYPIYTSGEFDGTDLKRTGGEALRAAAGTAGADGRLPFSRVRSMSINEFAFRLPRRPGSGSREDRAASSHSRARRPAAAAPLSGTPREVRAA